MKKLMKKANFREQTIQAYVINCSCACAHCPSMPSEAVAKEGFSEGYAIRDINN